MSKYAQVIVPVPVGSVFTYIVPAAMQPTLRPMMRVVVPFGRHKHYTAVVVALTDTFTDDYELKEILWSPDNEPVLRRPQLELWNWLAKYYMCSPGDVFKAALPAGLKIEAETRVAVAQGFDGTLPDKAPGADVTAVWQTISEKGNVSLRDLESAGHKNAMASVYELMQMGMVTVSEKLTERFRPKKEKYYNIVIPRGDDEALRLAFDTVKRSPRCQSLLMTLIQLSNFTNRQLPLKKVARKALDTVPDCDTSALAKLVEKGIIEMEQRVVSRFKWDNRPLKPLPVLSPAQSQALSEIHRAFTTNVVTLLHGVTSSGKTEIYMHLMDYVLRQGSQVLMLVPEIALTTQLTRRLQDVFGDRAVIYHSRFSDAERVEIWNRLLHSTEPLIVLGARSAVFLPFARLGLVIVDEEHESSYKQFDPAPRYNARDTATVLARLHGAKTLLGSATPTIETYYKATIGKYGLVSLTQRYSGLGLPPVRIVDMAAARRAKAVDGTIAAETSDTARQALTKGEQVIFFHNRRGFAPFAHCKSCEYIPKCTDCDVSLTYHRSIDRLVCHYCGKEYPNSVICPVCHEPAMEIVGYGTERVEDDITRQFDGARILRMDLDTTRNKDEYSTIIDAFSQHKADILVGTQMVTKGLDFGDVSTVAVLNADQLIHYPDFRSAERAFNMLEQVAGRAGRRKDGGCVLIQTTNPAHPVLNYVVTHDYYGFYDYELPERQAFGYPPFTRIIYIFVRHRQQPDCCRIAEELARRLKIQLGNRIMGPHEPSVNRVKTMYIRRIMVKVEPQVSVEQVKNILRQTATDVRALPGNTAADIYFDVDPY